MVDENIIGQLEFKTDLDNFLNRMEKSLIFMIEKLISASEIVFINFHDIVRIYWQYI